MTGAETRVAGFVFSRRRRCWRRRWEAVRKRSGGSSCCVCCGNTAELFPYMSMGEVEEREEGGGTLEGRRDTRFCWMSSSLDGKQTEVLRHNAERLDRREENGYWVNQQTDSKLTSQLLHIFIYSFIYQSFTMFSVQQVRNFMVGQNSRW